MKKIEFKGILRFDIVNHSNEHINKFLESFNKFFENKQGVIACGINKIKFSTVMFEYSINANFIVDSKLISEKNFCLYIQEFIQNYKYDIEGNIYNEDGVKFPFYKEPQYLYQYTSIETLALILKNKTIRFNSLANVDDGQEVKTKDFGDFGRFCLVSCWTDKKEELIPLWNMYTPNMQGVRIKLPVNPFKEFTYEIGEYNFAEKTKTWVNIKENYDKNKNAFDMPMSNFLIKVEYTDNTDDLIPSVIKKSYDNKEKTTKTLIDKSKIGIYKNKAWIFQNEWRYRIFLSPWTCKENEKVIAEKNPLKLIELFDRYKSHNLSEGYYDLELNEEKIAQIEILLGPRVTEAQKEIVQLLVDNFVKKNGLKNTIIVESSKLLINGRNV